MLSEYKKFLESLDAPNCVRIKTDVEAAQGTINSRVIQNLKCNKCFEYLIPPIFELENEPVCEDCSKTVSNSSPCTKAELQISVSDAYYPCRWRGCNFIVKSFQIKQHELKCPSRRYDCFVMGCNTTFHLSSTINHYKFNNINCLLSKMKYITKICEEPKPKQVCTIINPQLFLCNTWQQNILIVLPFYSSNRDKLEGTLDFEHNHCKLKSKLFPIQIGKQLRIHYNELPRCFKPSDDLTVQIEFNNYD